MPQPQFASAPSTHRKQALVVDRSIQLKHPSKSLAAGEIPSIELSPSGTPFEEIEAAPPLLTVENEDSSKHKDPVPASNMSAHLKNEHEAFKQR